MNLKDFNIEKYVAHYTKFDRVIKDILPFNEIRISSVSTVNDPYEKDESWIENDASDSKEDIIKNYQTLNKLKKDIFNYLKIFCVASYDELSKNCIDLSSDIYAKPRMWAHYGDNHKGICLIFDKEELSAQFRKSDFIKIYEDKVDYLSFLPLIGNSILLSKIELEKFESESYNLELLYEFLDDNYLLKFKYFRKHIDWKTENEYRWLVFAKNNKRFKY